MIQIVLLLFTNFLFHIGISNPNLSSTKDHVPYEGISFKFAVFIGPKFGKLITWIFTLYQVSYIFLQRFSPAFISICFPQMSAFVNPLPITAISVLGYVCMIIGGLGRIWCYRTLGKFFTYELTIRSTHKLIKSGPYAYVRHPSYTFLRILTVGWFFVHQRLANFFPNSPWFHIQFGPIGFLVCCLMVLLIVKRRVIREEEELEKKFGNEWTQYASTTKKFLPKLF